MNNKTKLIVGGVVLVGISFFGGVKYDQSKSTSLVSTNGQTRMAGIGGMRGTRGAGAFNGASGSVVAKDATSITIGLRDGTGSKIVFLSASTTVMKTTNGTVNDLIVGKEVSVNGSANPDGSINAQSIQLRPNPISK